MNYEECSICLNILKENIKILQCGHKIHNECIIKLENSNCPSKYKCPICRERINIINENRENNNIPLPIVQLFMFMNPFENTY